MNTTRAMLVIGLLMLILAVIVAQGLRPDETSTVSGPVISGTVSNAPAQTPTVETPAPPASGGVLVPLDGGTLKAGAPTAGNNLAVAPPVPAPAPEPAGAIAQATDVVAGSKNIIPPRADAARSGGATNTTVGNAAAPAADSASAPQASRPTPAAAPAKPESAKPEPAKPAAAEKTQQARQVVTTSAPKTLTAGQKAISRTRLEIGAQSATFRLTGVDALSGKAFALKEPDRIVVDLQGAWAINLGKTPVNKLLKSVRAGSQEANTRIVFDLMRPAKSFKLVQVAPKTLELQIR